MSDKPTFAELGVVHSTPDLESRLARGSDGALYLVQASAADLSAELASVFKGAARRVKSNPHEAFEAVVEVGAGRYVSKFVAEERLEQLHTALKYSQEDGIPAAVVARLVVQLNSGLALLHDSGQVCGPFDLSYIGVGIDGGARFVGMPVLAMKTHEAGTLPTSVSDMQSLGRVIQALAPRKLDEMDGWSELKSLGDRLAAGEIDDAIELQEADSAALSGASSQQRVSEWLVSLFSERRDRWSQVVESDDPVVLVADLMGDVPVVARPEPKKPEAPPVALTAPQVEVQSGAVTPVPQFIADGTKVGLWDNETGYQPTRVGRSIDDMYGALSATVPSGDPSSALCLTVYRCFGERVLDVSAVKVGDSYAYGDARLCKVTDRSVELTVPSGAQAWLFHRGEGKPCSGTVSMEVGDRAAVQVNGELLRLRVDHEPRQLGAASGVRRPWKLLGVCASIAVGAHLLFFAGIASLSSMGVSMTVEKPAEQESFADVVLKKEKPKPKPKKPKPKKPKKPKPKKLKKERPKKPEPADAPPKISKNLSEKLAKVRKRTKGAKSATEALLKSLAPDSEASSVSSVRANIDAVAANGRSGAFQVAGDLVAGAPGGKIVVGGGGGTVMTKGGVGKGVGTLKGRKRSGRVRGKVKTVRAMARVRGTLSRSEVLKGIQKRIGRIQACYEKRLQKGGKKTSGKITAEWTIATNGKVKRARSKLDTLGDPKVASCLLREIKKMKFPRPKGGEVVVVFPFMFSAR